MTRLLTGLIVLVAAVTVRAEQVDNPEYKMWSAYKAGATTTHSAEATAEGQAVAMKMTVTLKEVTAEKAVIERAVVAIVNGQEMAMPAVSETITAKIEAGKINPNYAAIEKPNVEKGEEELEVGGKKLACTWYKFEDTKEKAKGKVWMTDKVPGGLVKFDGESKGQAMKMMLLSYKVEAAK